MTNVEDSREAPPRDRSPADTPSGNGRSNIASSPRRILLVDDNPAVARALAIALEIAGYRLDGAASAEEAFSRLAAGRYDAILLDMNFSPGRVDGEEGLATLARIVADDPGACVVVVTAHSGLRIAVAAMQAGARDFVMKPWRNADLIAKVEAAIARVPATPGGTPGNKSGRDVEEPAVLLGESAAMVRLRDLVRRVGPTGAGVTVTGPAGSGRTLVARALHAASADGGVPVRVDLRDGTAWKRLERGAGTLLLRHVEALSEVDQARLLDRLSPSARVLAVAGSTAALIPALRRRVATVEIAVPPLATREDDAVLLARHFARLAAARFGRPDRPLSDRAVAAVRAGGWTDEVRGLALAVERAVLLGDGPVIDALALSAPGVPTTLDEEARFDLTDAERAMIEAALREHRHNVTHAAAALGLSRGALYRRMARYGL